MVTRVSTGMVQGIEGIMIMVETDLSTGLPMMNLYGSLAAEVREGKERVRTALKNMGIRLPPDRITINLAPGDIRKNGTSFDLAIAVSLLLALRLLPHGAADGILFLGELSLDGGLLPVHGVLPVVKAACDRGYQSCLVPLGNLEEASLVHGMQVTAFGNLQEVFHYLMAPDKAAWPNQGGVFSYDCPDDRTIDGHGPVSHITSTLPAGLPGVKTDFSEVRGQLLPKRALEIAVAGFHNVMLDGPPGVGKSMIASCVPGIMPEMTMEEKIETTMIYSVKGLLNRNYYLVSERPFRSPSHNITMMGLFGGGRNPVPGEISLAHRGVLFLDEFPEFKRELLEMLRVPLEDHKISLIRNNRTIEFPADFILITASNPCPCGYYPDRSRCRCSSREIHRYQNKISGPIRDRMDLFVRCEEVEYEELVSDKGQETSDDIKKKIEGAWEIQRLRYVSSTSCFNGRMDSADLRRFCLLTDEGSRLMAASYKHLKLSGRAYFRILKVARTIADLEEAERISTAHLEEALIFRNAAVC